MNKQLFSRKNLLFLLAAAAAFICIMVLILVSVSRAHAEDSTASVSSESSAVTESDETENAPVGNTDPVKGYTASGERVETSGRSFLSSSEEGGKITGFDPDDWRLVLVNKTHLLPENLTVNTTALDDGIYISECSNGVIQSVDGRIYGDLTSMLHDCLDAGYSPVVCSGYRTHDKQVSLFDAKVESVEAVEGVSAEEAEQEAGTVVAEPGTSEHELGLALDIYCRENMNLDESQETAPTQQWLMENSWKYGFVLRYPKDKTSITGITYEPWHYRYVGKDAAEVMHDRNLCLEEFVSLIASDK